MSDKTPASNSVPASASSWALKAALSIAFHNLESFFRDEVLEDDLSEEAVKAGLAFVADDITDQELEHARSLARIIRKEAKALHANCQGKGVLRDPARSADQGFVLCSCVQKRLAAVLEARSKVVVPGRQDPSVLLPEKLARLNEAKEVLARAQAAQAEACAEIDSKITQIELDNSLYLVKKAELEGALASEADRILTYKKVVKDAQDKAETLEKDAVPVSNAHSSIFHSLFNRPEMTEASVENVLERRNDFYMQAAENLGVLVSLLAQRDTQELFAKLVQEKIDEVVASQTALKEQFASLVEANKAFAGELEKLKRDRARVAKHHEPKVEKAQKRVRRLEFLSPEPEGSK